MVFPDKKVIIGAGFIGGVVGTAMSIIALDHDPQGEISSSPLLFLGIFASWAVPIFAAVVIFGHFIVRIVKWHGS
jgi:hypothetical protein